MSVVFTKARGLRPIGPGEWRVGEVYGRNRKEVWLRCPECSALALLDHEIDSHGRVSPSLVCPGECGLHVMAVLQDWSG